jgi:perosamine synthetase
VAEIVPGAPAAAGGIPLAVPSIGDRERELVADSLSSGWIAYGPYNDRFEDACAELTGRDYAVAVASGTAALHLSLLAAGVQPGDEVIVSTLTFISPGFAIRYCGATPVAMDAEPEHWQLDAAKLRSFLDEEVEHRPEGAFNRGSGRRVAAILPVDILGHPADMPAIVEAATVAGIPVVEDAAEGLGAVCRERPVGSFGLASCLSFNGNKIVTCGGGGVVVTDDERLAERVRYLATQAKDDPLRYVHAELGYNYRLSNMHAALALGQLERLDEFVAAKRAIAQRYTAAFADGSGIEAPREADWARSTFWLYTVLLRDAASRDAAMTALLDAGIQVRPLWQPLHRSPALEAASYSTGRSPCRLRSTSAKPIKSA